MLSEDFSSSISLIVLTPKLTIRVSETNITMLRMMPRLKNLLRLTDASESRFKHLPLFSILAETARISLLCLNFFPSVLSLPLMLLIAPVFPILLAGISADIHTAAIENRTIISMFQGFTMILKPIDPIPFINDPYEASVISSLT